MTDIPFPLPDKIDDVEEGNEFAPRFDGAGLIPAIAIDADTNAAALLNLLNGEQGAYRDIVILNTAAVLYISNKAETYKDCARMATQTIDNGSALEIMQVYKDFTQRYGQAA